VRFAPDLVKHPVAARQVVPPTSTQLSGILLDPDGARVAGARISARCAGESQTVRTAADGGYVLPPLPRGLAQIEVDGSGLVKTTQTIALDRPVIDALLRVARRNERAQLRGLVRSFAGTPLPASVRVGSTGKSVTADKDGRFVLELRPGDYEVDIECGGYLTQRRKVSVQANGVTLLNVELHAEER
jgi:hypothetical protein